jgi:hypothetical protein
VGGFGIQGEPRRCARCSPGTAGRVTQAHQKEDEMATRSQHRPTAEQRDARRREQLEQLRRQDAGSLDPAGKNRVCAPHRLRAGCSGPQPIDYQPTGCGVSGATQSSSRPVSQTGGLAHGYAKSGTTTPQSRARARAFSGQIEQARPPGRPSERRWTPPHLCQSREETSPRPTETRRTGRTSARDHDRASSISVRSSSVGDRWNRSAVAGPDRHGTRCWRRNSAMSWSASSPPETAQ